MNLGHQLTGLRLRRDRRRFLAAEPPTPRADLEHIGSSYGGWVVPAGLLGPDSVCLLAGAGEDISFDLGLIERFGCEVHTLDPVPRAAEHVAQAAGDEPRLRFHPIALWSRDETLTFHAPADPSFVSHSATNLQGTAPAFEARARSVASLMEELGTSRVDLLKISAEGSEYEILRHVLDAGLDVRALCVEFAQPVPLDRIRSQVATLRAGGYDLVDASIIPWNWRTTFARREDTGARERTGAP